MTLGPGFRPRAYKIQSPIDGGMGDVYRRDTSVPQVRALLAWAAGLEH